MSVMTTTLPRGRALTIEDLEAMPDDGNRYELIDGVLVVSASPMPRHQRMAFKLGMVLEAAVPDDLWLMALPVDVELDRRTMVAPDLVVAPRSSFNEKRLPAAPLLAVEILSPSTRLTDLNVKFARFERAGIPSYWVLDPAEARLVAWELVDGKYVEVADVVGDESWTATKPFAVTITPGALLD